MKFTTRDYFVAALVALLVLALGVSRWQLSRARHESASNALRADSISAAMDTTRRVALSERDRVKILGDSLQALERRGVQLESIARDALDKATKRTTVVRGGVTVTPGTVATTEAEGASTVTAGDVRNATFHVDSSAAQRTTRFVADAEVRIPPLPAPPTLTLAVQLSPIDLSARIQCGEPDAGGVRPASLAVLGPVGVTLAVQPVVVDVHACNPEFGRPGGVRLSLTQAGTLAVVTAAVTAWLFTR